MRLLKMMLFVVMVAGFCLQSAELCADEVAERIEAPVHQAIVIRQETQKSEEEWRDLRHELESRLAQLEAEVARLDEHRQTLVKDVAAAKTRIAGKEKELADIARIGHEMAPFLAELTARLNSLPADGLPFLRAEREQRLARLKQIMNDPQIEISERYRKSMEVLLIEAEYGLTIETYQQEIEVENRKLLVNLFRLGRLGLYYQSLDETQSGFYNVALKSWQALPKRYNQVLQTAIAIAAKQRPAEMLDLPLGRLVQR